MPGGIHCKSHDSKLYTSTKTNQIDKIHSAVKSKGGRIQQKVVAGYYRVDVCLLKKKFFF